LPHIGKKISEFKPAITNVNSSTAVAMVHFVSVVRASFLHLNPGAILRSSSSPVFKTSSRNNLFGQAPARSTCSRLKVESRNDSHVSAVAFAMPVRLSRSIVRGAADDGPSVKTSVYKIGGFHNLSPSWHIRKIGG
jgi:hypothetical protein